MLYSVWQSCAHRKFKALRGQQNRGVDVVWPAKNVHRTSQRRLGLSLDLVRWMRGAELGHQRKPRPQGPSLWKMTSLSCGIIPHRMLTSEQNN